MNRLEEIMARLQKNDYKLTPQRQLVVQALLRSSGEHLSAEEVYNIVKKESPEIGLATVYRTLDLLSDLGILRKMDFGDGRARFEFADDTHQHHHLICLSCGTVAEFGEDLLDSLEDEVERRTGFQITDHQLKFYGYCRACARQQAEREAGSRGTS